MSKPFIPAHVLMTQKLQASLARITTYSSVRLTQAAPVYRDVLARFGFGLTDAERRRQERAQ